MTQERVNEIIIAHQHWLNRDCEGWENMRADFSNEYLEKIDFNDVNLREANFNGAHLQKASFELANLSGATFVRANFRKANLFEANLCGADLCEAIFSRANLCRADFRAANLYRAMLFGANLGRADFKGANLCEVDIREANIKGACFEGAQNVPYIPLACPEEGSFIGWKKVEKYIIKLEIPATAKRSSGTSRYCRCEYAKVLGIYTASGEKADVNEVINDTYEPLTYKTGEMVYPDRYDEDRWNVNSHGIYFFINRQEAVDYYNV